MRCRKSNTIPGNQVRLLLALTTVALLAFSSGCARKPWRQPVAEQRYEAIIELLTEMRQGELQRSSCIDADVDIFFTSSVKNRAASGYMQLMQPLAIKFVSANPLGQPLVVFVSDGRTVQFVNTLESFFTDGELADFARVFDIPPVASGNDWGAWITGRLPRPGEVVAIREDEQENGVWVSVADSTAARDTTMVQAAREHVLIDPGKRLVAGRVFTDAGGSIEARVRYADWLPEAPGGPPVQPGKIIISELAYGGQLTLELSSLQSLEFCAPANFLLRRPPGYRYQPLPKN